MITPEATSPRLLGETTSLAAGRAAIRAGEWASAVRAFAVVADDTSTEERLAAEACEGIALAAYWLDDATTTISHHERAYAGYRRVGMSSAAARMALWLADDHISFYGSGAVANGWIEQADRLLSETPDAPEHAWLPIYKGHHALHVYQDSDRALALATEALEIARRLDVPDAEVVALALEGLALVVRGDIDDGMPRLDQATAAAVAREAKDVTAAAWAFCYLIHGCETARDFDRAAEWCQRALSFCERWGLGPIFTSCRSRYASVLTWQGNWSGAEDEIDKLLAGHPAAARPRSAVRAAVVRLGEVRRRQGRFEEAESLFRQAGEHRGAILGRSAIALARGEPEVAADLAERVLRLLPLSARPDRADALLLNILALTRLGRVAAAEESLRELRQVADRFGAPTVLAAAAHARGAVAMANRQPMEALTALEDALVHYDQGGAPLEAAQIRLELAEVLLSQGHLATARGEAIQARDELERLGAGADLQRAEELLRRIGPSSPHSRPGPVLTDREIEVLRLVGQGLNNSAVARELFLSPHTVKRHIANILRKLGCSTRAAAVAWAAREGVL